MTTFFIRTFGCQMNKNDSAIISHLLLEAGMHQVDRVEQAEVVIVNTCSVRDHAEQRACGYIASLRSWRERNKHILAVVGCMAQRCAPRLTTAYPYIDLILGPDRYREIAAYLNNIMKTSTRICDVAERGEVYDEIHPRRTTVTDFISIMRGCDNFCSYCIVPYVRGRARSRDAEDIITEATAMVRSGVTDITLLGQNVNEYRFGSIQFAELMETVASIHGLRRLRFLTSHPKDLNKEIVDVVAREPAVCEWFHLPLQSGSDRILSLMNRQYTIEHYTSIIAMIRTTIPEATITTDIIVGFPTESDREYQDTIDAVNELQFDDAYTYRYSPRPGTKAANRDTLSEAVIKQRLQRLITVQTNITEKKIQDMKGRTFEVLFEAPAKHGGTRGKTRGNKDVIVPQEVIPGTIAQVKIERITGRTPIGVVVQ